ncbi:hypothetical protein Tco_1571623 [Tanacetum coccineum]
MVRGEAMEASKRRRSMLDYRIQQLSKGTSEGSGIISKVPDEPKDNSDPINGVCSHSSRGPSCPKNSAHTVIIMNLVLASPLYVQKAFDNRCTYAGGEFSKDENIKNQRNLPRDIPLDKIEVLRTSELYLSVYNDDENPSRANIKQALRYEHAGPKVTSSQVGKRSQDDDKRFDLADDLKEAQDQSLSCK